MEINICSLASWRNEEYKYRERGRPRFIIINNIEGRKWILKYTFLIKLFDSTGTLRRARNYHHEGHKPTTMDDLPVPTGSWQAQHEANQKKFNLQLALGIGFAVATILTVCFTF